jgi:hypothetical protein
MCGAWRHAAVARKQAAARDLSVEWYGGGRATAGDDIRGFISLAHQARCATKCIISVANWTWCATEIVKPIIGDDRVWAPPSFYGAWNCGAPQK